MLQLRVERQRRGLSLVDMCQKTGIAPSMLSEVERGMRHAWPGWRRRISTALAMPEEELFREVVYEPK